MEGYVSFQIGSSFYINAGIAGLVKFLDENDGKYKYIIDGQFLHVDKSFFEENDIPKLFRNTMAKVFEKDSKFYILIDRANYIEKLLSEEQDDKAEKQIKDFFKEFAATIEKNSFKSAYEIADKYYQLETINDVIIKDFKQEKDNAVKLEKCKNIIRICQQDELYNTMLFKEAMYTKIKMFYEGTSFFLPANLKKTVEELYSKDFYKPFFETLNQGELTKGKRCIECGELAKNTKSISFMIDSVEDVARKKSSFWNYKPDAHACEKCSLLYTFVPLGFAFLGRDAVFINNNADIKTLISFMNAYLYKFEDDKMSAKARLYKSFIGVESEILKERLHNIQVVVRNSQMSHFQMNIIGKDIIAKLSESKNYLKYLEGKYVKFDGGYINVYDEVLENIINGRQQYPLIHRLLTISLQDSTSSNYLINILRINIIFKGGENLKNLQERIDFAYKCGIAMRNQISDSNREQDVDNSLRGFVYKLSNAVSVNNRDMFIDTVIRIYSGRGIPMPSIFKDCLESDEVFKALGQAYILGLKYSKKENDKKESEDNKNE